MRGLNGGRIVGKTTSSGEYRNLRDYFEEELDGTAKPGFATILRAIKTENKKSGRVCSEYSCSRSERE